MKVLDFGLAKAFAGDEVDASVSNSPTLSMAATQQGMILGTAAYMSPEQAKGRAVDKRTDIFAFGCVLYEMLTGRQSFGKSDVAESLSAVISLQPEWDTLPPNLHPRLREVVERCLDKQAATRFQDIGDVKADIEKVLADPSGVLVQSVGGVAHAAPQSKVPWVVTGVALLIAVVASWSSGPASSNQTAARFAIDVSGELPPRVGHLLALSPDGQELVYRALTEEGDQLYRRPINGLEAVPIRGSEGADFPFFSPDGQWLAFGSPDGLKRVSLAGESPTTICECGGFGSTWGPDQTIVFSDSNTLALSRVSLTGGAPEQLTSLQAGEIYHDEPAFLPAGDAVLFTIWSGSLDTGQIAVVSLQTGERKVLGNGFFPRYSPTGHLLYAQTGASLWAVPFDESRLKITGNALPVLEGVRIEGGGAVQFALAESGAMTYIPADMGDGARALVWVDRAGSEEPLQGETLAYGGVQISPDGMRVALVAEGPESREDLWLHDVVGETTRPFIFDVTTADMQPLWTPDGQHVVFLSDPGGVFTVFRRRADGTDQAESIAVLPPGLPPILSSVSPDGETLVYAVRPETDSDLRQLSLVGEPSPQALLASDSGERHAQISPDGRWMVYSSDELGQPEILVRPFPNVADGGPWRVSRAGGEEPIWSPNGTEIYYRQGSRVMAATVATTPAFVATQQRELFSGPYLRSSGFRSHTYDIAPDGERFLMIRESENDTLEGEIIVVLNWFEELKERVPVP